MTTKNEPEDVQLDVELREAARQQEIDISNLRFYSRMAAEFKWGTDIIHFGVIEQTLKEIADRLALLRRVSGKGAQRDLRQKEVSEWCAAAFGADHACSIPQRGIRMLEEAIEAYQSATLGLPAEEMRAKAHGLVDYVMDRLAGNLAQECGGVGLTLLALCQSAGISAEAEELREIARVKSKPLEHFQQRNQAKNEAGFEIVATTQGTPEGAR